MVKATSGGTGSVVRRSGASVAIMLPLP